MVIEIDFVFLESMSKTIKSFEWRKRHQKHLKSSLPKSLSHILILSHVSFPFSPSVLSSLLLRCLAQIPWPNVVFAIPFLSMELLNKLYILPLFDTVEIFQLAFFPLTWQSTHKILWIGCSIISFQRWWISFSKKMFELMTRKMHFPPFCLNCSNFLAFKILWFSFFSFL